MAASEKTPLHSNQEEGEDKDTFSSNSGLVCVCLGSAIGTGNIWRFPRVAALCSGKKGGLCFLLVWLLVLVLWSIPMLVIEYGVGRYTRKAVTRSFQQLIGTRSSWCGFWITAIEFCIGAYYAVIAGWCVYYAFYFIVHPLPTTYDNSTAIFNSFAQESTWPLLTQTFIIVLSGVLLLKGVSIIERANLFLAPALLLILFVLVVWAALRPNASRGLAFLFSPDWETLKEPSLWTETASQSAFDTNAGTGIFITLSAYMSRNHPAVKLAVVIPILNNVVSLFCGMMVFSTVFSSLSDTNPNITDDEILGVLQTTGPGSTGLTFVWLPLLMETAGNVGRIMSVLFFICLIFAALSSVIAIAENTVHMLEDFQMPRKYCVLVTQAATFLLGIGSALNLQFLTNQDVTWGIALLMSGLMLAVMVIIFGAGLFRQVIINEHGVDDWKLPKLWEYAIKFLSPGLIVALVSWWIAQTVISNDNSDGYTWHELGPKSLLSILLQWLLVMLIAVVVNVTLECLQPEWYTTTKIGPNYTSPDSAGSSQTNNGVTNDEKPLEMKESDS